MVSVRVNCFWVVLLYSLCVFMWIAMWDKTFGQSVIDSFGHIFMVVCAVLFTLLVDWFVNYRTIFDGNGMIVKYRIGLLFLTFYKKSYKVSWREIDVSYDLISARASLWAFELFFMQNGKVHKTILHSSQANYKKALRLIVQKLPRSNFSMSAQKQLRKMRIADWSEFEEF